MRLYILASVLALSTFVFSTFAQENGGCLETGMLPYDYGQALCMSFLFFEAQRSGYLPEDNRLDWRGDSAVDDGSYNGLDLEGGYYDGEGAVKYGFPFAFSFTILSWGLDVYSDGFEIAGQTEYGLSTIKVATDYLLKCHLDYMELVGQVGDDDIDDLYWGRPEDMTMARPAYTLTQSMPGSDLAGETAAALAAASIVFQETDATYASELLDTAVEMLEFADTYRDSYVNNIPAGDFYNSWNGYKDELTWAACWLYKATGNESYYTQAEQYYNDFNIGGNQAIQFFWDDKTAGIFALMAEFNQDPKYLDRLAEFLDGMQNVRHTSGGLIFIQEWGSIRHALNLAFIALRGASLGIDPTTYQTFAQDQMHYALGSFGHSFVVGFGVNPPTHAHHKAASCNYPPAPCNSDDLYKEEPNPHVLYGGVVAGPNDMNDHWVDSRSDWQMTEVTLEHGAGFAITLAGIIELRNYTLKTDQLNFN